jgi:hypothetical protein
VTSPSCCASGHKKVCIPAVSCELCSGTSGLQAAGAAGLSLGQKPLFPTAAPASAWFP